MRARLTRAGAGVASLAAPTIDCKRVLRRTQHNDDEMRSMRARARTGTLQMSLKCRPIALPLMIHTRAHYMREDFCKMRRLERL